MLVPRDSFGKTYQRSESGKTYQRLTKEVKADLRIWQEFLHKFNDRSFFLEDRWYSSQYMRLFTDAAGSLRFGAVFGDRWCYGEWPSNWKGKNVAILELYPTLVFISGVLLLRANVYYFTLTMSPWCK